MWNILYLSGAIVLVSYLLFQKKYKDLQLKLAFIQEKADRLDRLENDLKEKTFECIQLEIKYASSQEKINFLTKAQESSLDSFRSLSFEALEKNSQSFLELAKSTLEKYQEGAKAELEKRQLSMLEAVAPVKEALTKIDSEMKSLEKERKGDQEALKEHLRLLVDSEKHLRTETSMLVKALRTPIGRGRWGEIQLRRVVELAGMINHCDFFEQQSKDIGDVVVRPDLLIKLPGGRQVIVDAKVPLDAYLDASVTNDDELKSVRLKDHARQLRQHLSNLSKKSYWQHFQPSPELVILFLPSEAIYSAALEYDPSLLEL
ncbi:MAG: DNA recombination protein RmuC, partial [Chlamydiae bacterium]|nr:DNA recombination protein RmuC [Chlamydiota bacterium]